MDTTHDTGGGEVLPGIEDGLQEQDDEQDDCEGQVRSQRWISKRFPREGMRLKDERGVQTGDGPSNKANDAGAEEKSTKPAKEPFEELSENVAGRRGDLVLAVGGNATRGLGTVKSGGRGNGEALEEGVERDCVPVQGGKF